MFKENLKKLREKFGFTQEQMAEKLKMTRQTYSKLETGTKEIGIKSLQQVAKIFNVTTDALLGTDIDAQFLTNTKPKELRDYIYIDKRKVRSYLGSLGYSDIVKISNQITSGHENDFGLNGKAETEGGFSLIAKGKATGTANTTLSKSKERVQSWEETRREENLANTLLDEIEKNDYLSEELKQGNLIKLNLNIKNLNTVSFFRDLFKTIPMIEQLSNKKLIPSEYDKLFKSIENDLINEDKKVIIQSDEEKTFYSKLIREYLLIENEEELNDMNCTIIAKIKENTKNQKPIIDFKSLRILPLENKKDFYDKLTNIPKMIDPNSGNMPFYFENGDYILEAIAIYQ